MGEIKLIKSEDNFADVLTKNVSVNLFKKLGIALLNGFIGHEDRVRVRFRVH